MNPAERDLISASAKKDPTGWGSQEIVDTVSRLGKAGDLEALDLLISQNHWSLTDVYIRGYREAQRNKDPAPLEQRLLDQYDHPRMAVALMHGLDKYASSALLDRLIDDATRLAKRYASEATRCQIVVVPRETSSPQSLPGASSSNNFAAADASRSKAKLDCAGETLSASQERFRMEEAVRMLGKTDRTDVVRRIVPLLASLTVTSMPHDEEARVIATGQIASRVRNLHSIAEIIRRQQYRGAGVDLTAIVRKVPASARTGSYLAAMWPLMQALGQLDRREGTEAIAEWIDWRSMSKIDAATSPTPAEMIRLLGPVLPAAQIDVAALRCRVMRRVPEVQRADYEKAFDAAEKENRELREPEEATLVAVTRQNSPRLVRYVLSRGITPNARDSMGDTALTAVAGNAQGEYQEVLGILIDAGADPDGADRDGVTPFHKAVRSFSLQDVEPYKMVDFWYARKVDVNRVAAQGTPLASAAERSTEMVKYLLERGANTDLANHKGLTPLHVAARAAKAESVKQLLAAGGRVNAKDRENFMPLHYAVLSKSIESAELLLKAGADVNAEIQDGLTPLLIAQDAKDSVMEALLKQYGGRVNLGYKAKRAAWIKSVGEFYRRGH
jgi:hypothetical protein